MFDLDTMMEATPLLWYLQQLVLKGAGQNTIDTMVRTEFLKEGDVVFKQVFLSPKVIGTFTGLLIQGKCLLKVRL